LSKRQVRWLETLQAHTYQVKYQPEKTNVITDALSRQPHLATILEVTATLFSNEELEKMYQEDSYFHEILEALRSPASVTPKQLVWSKNYQLKDGQVYLKKETHLAIPNNKNIQLQLMQEHHSIPISSHVGIEKTYDSIA
jgi:hypothetical protein